MRTDDFFADLFAKTPGIRRIAAEVDPPHVLAANVIDLRRQHGVTQAALAAKVGIAQPRIAEIERGDANPRLSTIIRLALALDVTVEELLRPPPDFAIAPHQPPAPGEPADAPVAEGSQRRRRAG